MLQLDDVKQALPILAEEIRACRDIIIEDQGQTVAYVQKTQAEHKFFYPITSRRPRPVGRN